MDNLLIGVVAVNPYYIKFAKNLINQINANVSNSKFLILTDLPSEFLEFNNVTTIIYDKNIFSYHDKNIIFKEGFKISNNVLLLDADTALRDDNCILNIDIDSIQPGIYPQIIWKHPATCSIENFFLGNTCRVPYGLSYKQFCIDNNINFTGAQLIQESFLLIKKNENIIKFIETWEKLADFCNKQDMERNQDILGYGEGYSIGVSASNSNLQVFENNENVDKLISCFKHYAWEQW
jgi:hypothetical protein